MLKKILLPTVVISGTLVASFGALLFTQGSKPVQIQLENRQVFDGQFKDIFTPQLGALLTIGITATTALVLAWRQSAKESSKLSKRLTRLQTEISYKDAQINELKVAPTSPMLSSLDWFLEGEYVTSSVPKDTMRKETMTPHTVKDTVKEIPEQLSQPVLSVRPATKPLMTPMSSVSYQVITTTQPIVQNATSALPSAQSALGLTQRYRKAEVNATSVST
jgi:hypothetical protein